MENHVTVDRCQMQIFDIYPFLKACKETRSFKDVMNCLFFCPYDTRIRTYVL